MLRIEAIVADGYAADMELEAGDDLLSINGIPLVDVVDYHRCIEAESLVIEVQRQNGDLWVFELEKSAQEDLGLEVEHPQPRQCGNQCLFCFIHQLPRGLRRSLYIKDEDYRFSYLYGNYITLTNLREKDLQRIVKQQLSPLYISVHATSPAVREKLLGARVPDIVPLLQRLTAGGIDLHCQIVLCPGINDGTILEQTIEFLATLRPRIVSLAVVPVGLTTHREQLPRLQPLDSATALACIKRIQEYQDRFQHTGENRFVYLADEFYLLAGTELPSAADYDGFPQLENGVGMVSLFRQQSEEVLLEAEPLKLDHVTLVTGVAFAAELEHFAERISLRTGVLIQVVPIENDFFGSGITVAGLVTGTDLVKQLRSHNLGQALFIPEVMLKDDETVFLDDMTVVELERQLDTTVRVIENTPWGVLDALEALADSPVDVFYG